jgi:signal transduction histidine kinase
MSGSTEEGTKTASRDVSEPDNHLQRARPLRDAQDLRRFVHAIRNPLNGARLHLIFIERELARLGASSDSLDAAHVIGEEIDHIATLVRDLLEAPAEPRPRTLVSLRSLCARAIQLLSDQSSDVQIGTELEDPDLVLEVHRQQMEQVLFDLLHRALQGALGGGGRVLLRGRRDAESGQVVIEIRHDGGACTTGLGPQLEADAGADFNVALSIVAEHGGTIDVVTRPGQACFHVKLPLSRVEHFASAAELG